MKSSQILTAKVGKKGAIYLPKRVMKELGIKEGDRVLIRVDDDKLTLEFVPDPLSLALRTRKWAKTTVEEFEAESEREQVLFMALDALLDSTYLLPSFE